MPKTQMAIAEKTAEKAVETLIETLTAKTIGYALTVGFVSSLLATYITMIFLGALTPGDHYIPIVAHGPRFVAEFFVLLATVAAISVLLSFRETNMQKLRNEDMLSGFRKKLAGYWEIEFRSWNYDDEGKIIESRPIDHALFDVDKDTYKLVVRLNVRDGPFWQKDQLTVRAVSIWPAKDPANLDLYYKPHLEMKSGRIVEGQVFVHTEIEFDRERPVRLSGVWYDLDGTFARAKKDFIISKDVTPAEDLPTSGIIEFTKLEQLDAAPEVKDVALTPVAVT